MNLEQIQIQLNEMLEADLQKRNELIERGELFDGYHPEMEAIHMMNSNILEQIIDEIGFPTKHKVGQEAANAAWTIVMHSISNPPFMKKVLSLLRSPDYINEVDSKQLAYLEDRVRVFSGEPQIYGTQFDWDEHNQLSPYPIENLEQANVLRERIGLLPLEEQIKFMRDRAKQEGEQPPANYLERKREMEEWAKQVGWRS